MIVVRVSLQVEVLWKAEVKIELDTQENLRENTCEENENKIGGDWDSHKVIMHF